MRPKLQYILTWVSLGIMLLSAISLLVASWNATINNNALPFVMILFWVLITASGIYLFTLAVKKAHRSWIQEKQSQQVDQKSEAPKASKSSKDEKTLDFASTARKLVRRTPDGTKLEDMGNELLKNLARELEIMSGIFYLRKGDIFEPAASYALLVAAQPYSFKEGDGLSGQVAKNKQIMVLSRLPGDYVSVYSGLGKAEPKYLAIVPLVHHNKTVAILECSGFKYDPAKIELMFRIFSRDVMEKITTKE